MAMSMNEKLRFLWLLAVMVFGLMFRHFWVIAIEAFGKVIALNLNSLPGFAKSAAGILGTFFLQ
jgi:hypothetical protein